MKLSAVSLVVALGALLLVVLRSPGQDTSTGRDAVAPGVSAAGGGDLETELAALRTGQAELLRRLDRLEERQTELENRPVTPVGAARQPVGAISEEELEGKLREMVASLEAGEPVSSGGLETLVLDVLADKENEEEMRRLERRRQVTEARVNERMLELTEELGLTRDQSSNMHGVLIGQELRREELFTTMRRDGVFDRTTMRDGMQAIRDESRTQLQSILGPDQFDRYLELEGDRFGGFRGVGGGRGGGGGPRGGG